MNSLVSRWQMLSEKVNALSVRERAIIFVTSLAIVLLAWAQFVFTPWEKERDQSKNKLATLQQEVLDADTEIKVLNIKLGKNPNDELRKEVRTLSTQLDELGLDIEQRLAQLLAPQQMVPVMQNILSDSQGMKLLGAKNLPAEPLDLGSEQDDLASSGDRDEENEDSSAVVYSHIFEMTLEGSYFQTLSFLKRLEDMESGFFWRSVDYQVTDYPKAQIVIQIMTLSLEEEWIGV